MTDPTTVNTTELLAAFRANLDDLHPRRHDPITVDGSDRTWFVETVIAWGSDLIVVTTDDAARALSIADFISRVTVLATSTPQFRASRPVSVERPGALDGGPIRWVDVNAASGVCLRLDEPPAAPEPTIDANEASGAVPSERDD